MNISLITFRGKNPEELSTLPLRTIEFGTCTKVFIPARIFCRRIVQWCYNDEAPKASSSVLSLSVNDDKWLIFPPTERAEHQSSVGYLYLLVKLWWLADHHFFMLGSFKYHLLDSWGEQQARQTTSEEWGQQSTPLRTPFFPFSKLSLKL